MNCLRKLGARDLPRGRLGQRRNEAELARRCARAAATSGSGCADRPSDTLAPGFTTTQATSFSPSIGSGRPSAADSATAAVRVQHFFDFARENPLAGDLDHLRAAAREVQEAVRVEPSEIARVEPSARVDAPRRPLVARDVALHDPRARRDHVPDLAAADRRSVVTQDLDRDPGQRATARADALEDLVRAEVGEARGRLGLAVVHVKARVRDGLLQLASAAGESAPPVIVMFRSDGSAVVFSLVAESRVAK